MAKPCAEACQRRQALTIDARVSILWVIGSKKGAVAQLLVHHGVVLRRARIVTADDAIGSSVAGGAPIPGPQCACGEASVAEK